MIKRIESGEFVRDLSNLFDDFYIERKSKQLYAVNLNQLVFKLTGKLLVRLIKRKEIPKSGKLRHHYVDHANKTDVQ